MTMMLAAAPDAETFVTHLECGYTGELFEADKLHNLSSAGKPLLVRYDLDGVKSALRVVEHINKLDQHEELHLPRAG